MRMSTDPSHSTRRDPANATTPWFRHGWVWFLIGIPASAVIAGVITITIAVKTADSLVADDYYKEGRAINQRLEKDQAAQSQGIQLTASIRPQSSGAQRIQVIFQANPGVPAPDAIRLRLSHPTLNQMDVTATLVKSADGSYQSEVPGLSSGRWYAQLEDDQSHWRVKATWTVN